MNNIDKIKALLDQPNVKSITIPYDLANGKMHSVTVQDLAQFNYAMFDQGPPEYFEVEFHEWPEISEGDTVMTPHGEGKVWSINDYKSIFKVESDDWDIGPIRVFDRTEIALLSKAE